MFVASFSSTLFANFLLPSSSSIPTGPYWSLLVPTGLFSQTFLSFTSAVVYPSLQLMPLMRIMALPWCFTRTRERREGEQRLQ